ncbi:MAG: hypothetical protein SFT81_02335 [Candidatus Caenarcaniphilales bacterium]|nr:hypothetical protein [Candidatus Caenarcaniphilales bacterium]
MQPLFRSNNSPYLKFIRGKSEAFYQASLLLAEDKQMLSWILFAFWHGLNPFAFWEHLDGPAHFLRSWRNGLLFADGYEGELTIPQNAALDLQGHFSSDINEAILMVLNSLESVGGAARFPTFQELFCFLDQYAGSIAQASAQIIFREYLVGGQVENLEPLRQFGAYILWWELLQRSGQLVQFAKLFIPLTDLQEFRVTEPELLTEMKSPLIKRLTDYELNRIQVGFSDLKKQSASYPREMKDFLAVLCNYLSEEVNSALRSSWQLSLTELPRKKNKMDWLIGGFTRFRTGLHTN